MVWSHKLAAICLLLLCQCGMAETLSANGASGSGAGAIASQVVVLDPSADRLDLWRGLHTVADREGRLNPQEVEAQVDAGKAGALPHPHYAFGKGFPYP